jgi:hypothetical protein
VKEEKKARDTAATIRIRKQESYLKVFKGENVPRF